MNSPKRITQFSFHNHGKPHMHRFLQAEFFKPPLITSMICQLYVLMRLPQGFLACLHLAVVGQNPYVQYIIGHYHFTVYFQYIGEALKWGSFYLLSFMTSLVSQDCELFHWWGIFLYNHIRSLLDWYIYSLVQWATPEISGVLVYTSYLWKVIL